MSKNNYLTIAGIVIVVAVIAIFAWFWLGRTKPLTLSLVEAKNGDITEKVNLTGQVKASQGVDLAFEGSGKIVANYVKTGDKIYAGQALLATDSSILQAQLQQAQAQLDALNINTVESKTNVSLQSAYASGLASAQKSVSLAKDALLSVFDIEQVSADTSLWDAKGKPVESLFGQGNAGFWQTYQIARLTGGALGLVQTAVNNPTPANIDAALAATQKALQDLSYFINIIQVEDLSALNRALTIQQKNAINQEIITTSANIQTIASLKVNNTATLTTTNAQIEAAEASVNMIKAQLAKTVIRALFNGQVDKDNAIVGQIASPGTPVITISNTAK